MIKQYSINIKIQKEVHLPSLLKALGDSESQSVQVSVLRDGNTKCIKSMFMDEATVAAVSISSEQTEEMKPQFLAQSIYDAHSIESAFLSFKREKKLDELRAMVKPLLDDADKLVNKKEDASLSSATERTYRQALRDVTEPYKADMSLLDAVDLDSFAFPSKP